MKKKFIGTFAVITALVVLAIGPSCGTIFHGSMENVSIRSLPESKVYVDGTAYKTPVVVKLSRGSDHTIRFEKAGYETHTVTIGHRIDGLALVSNILFTGLIGIVVDFADGAAYSLTEDEIVAQLDKAGARLELAPPNESEFYVALADQEQVDAFNAAVMESK